MLLIIPIRVTDPVQKEHRRILTKEDLHFLPHPEYIHRVEALIQNQNVWVLVYHAGLITRGHNTNNYSKETIRILKDIALCRTKAYNAVALVGFVIHNLEQYFENWLLGRALHREASH